MGCHSRKGYCRTLAGISTGASEEDVIERLGKPSKEDLSGGVERLYYKDLHIAFHLEKKHVYMLLLTDET
jgi:hypothetical protein